MVPPSSFVQFLGVFVFGGALAEAVKRNVPARRNTNGEIVEPWDGKDVKALHREYGNIFKHGNRNAASHLWSSFLIDRAPFMSPARFEKLSTGFCAVSGSPVTPMSQTRYKMKLERVDGSGKQLGYMYYCCWPCVCDTEDFIRSDTKTILTRDGPKKYNVAVIGNPCDKPEKLREPFKQPFDKSGRSTTIAESAAEVRCGPGGKLQGATMSDRGFVILSLFFGASGDNGKLANEEFRSQCDSRKDQGYNSGMGEIFRRVAAISPVKTQLFLDAPAKMNVKNLRLEAHRRGLDTRGITEKTELVELLNNAAHAELQKLSVKELRLEAHRRGLDLRAVAEKADFVRLLEESMGVEAAAPETQEFQQIATKDLKKLSVKELRLEAHRRGLDLRAVAEKADFVRLLEESMGVRTASSESQDCDTADDGSCKASAEDEILSTT